MTFREHFKRAIENKNLINTRRLIDRLISRGYDYEGVRAAAGRAVGHEINPCEWEDLMYEIDTMPEYERI